MKNLKTLSREELKSVNGGIQFCLDLKDFMAPKKCSIPTLYCSCTKVDIIIH